MYFLNENSVTPSLLIVFIANLATPASADVLGEGLIDMEGAINSSACSIRAESRDQTIDMQVIPLQKISRDGRGLIRLFSLQLVNCQFYQGNSRTLGQRNFQVSFEGSPDGREFGVVGDARGVALRIADLQGNVIYPGVPMSIDKSINKDMKLSYSMQLVANNQVLRAGDYRTAIRFKLNYY